MAKAPKWDTEIERIVLSHMLESSEALIAGIDKFHYSNFIKKEHRRIYEALVRMENNDEEIDVISLSEELKGEVSAIYVTELLEVKDLEVTSPTVWKRDFQMFESRNLRIRLFKMAAEVGNIAKDKKKDPELALKAAENGLTEIEKADTRKEVRHIGEVTLEYFAELEELMANPDKNTRGIDSGYYSLDKKLGGFTDGTLVVVAGRPSMGKSAFVLNLALKISMRNIGTAFFSLEGPEKELVNRAASITTEIAANRINQGAINIKKELPKIQEACSTISQLPLFVDDTSKLSLIELRRKVRRLKFKHPDLKVIIVDYLQIMAYELGVSKNEAISWLTAGILKIAKDLDLVAIVLSQLNRDCEKRTDKRPMLSDLRESGAIEQDAHQVLFLYRDEYYYQEKSKWPGIAEVLIAKNRNGNAGIRERMNFRPEILKFEERE